MYDMSRIIHSYVSMFLMKKIAPSAAIARYSSLVRFALPLFPHLFIHLTVCSDDNDMQRVWLCSVPQLSTARSRDGTSTIHRYAVATPRDPFCSPRQNWLLARLK